MFTIDGLEWDIPCGIKRVSRLEASDISGLMLDKSYFNDVIGTYLQYTVQIAVPLNMRSQYAQIYEALTNPVGGHAFVFPYNNDTVEITGRVGNVADVYVRLTGGENYWKGIQFTVIANTPTKALSLGEVVAAGMSPLPSIAEPDEGDSYTYTSGGWVPAVSYDDADDIYY